jgi:hypothetical protein
MIQDEIDAVVAGIRGLNIYIREIVIQLSKDKFDLYITEPNRAITTILNSGSSCVEYNFNELRIKVVWNNFGENEVTSFNYYLSKQL